MLILTRKCSESFKIGDDVTVTVLGVKGNQVRLGIGAPRQIAVHREEIYWRIARERATANHSQQEAWVCEPSLQPAEESL